MHDNLQSVKEANAVKKLQASLSKEAAEKTYDEKVKIEQLTKIIRSNAHTGKHRGESRPRICQACHLGRPHHGGISGNTLREQCPYRVQGNESVLHQQLRGCESLVGGFRYLCSRRERFALDDGN